MKTTLLKQIASPFHASGSLVRGALSGCCAVALIAIAATTASAECPTCSDGSFIGDMCSHSGNGCFVGDCQGRGYGQPDLFYNYFSQGNCNQVNAQMYTSPLPVPPNVGHTYFTYQPFYPHEMLYWHNDRFHRYYDNGRGMNRTHAIYYSPPVRQAASNFYWNFLRLPR